MLDTIKFEAILVGHVPAAGEDSWEHIKFVCRINGQDFDYSLGMGHVKTNTFHMSTRPKEPGYKAFKLNGTSDGYIGYVKPPALSEVLNCLFLDPSANELCFEDWCNEYGYDDDSIKAKSTYDACISNYHKLKKALGSSYNDVKSTIDAMEL